MVHIAPAFGEDDAKVGRKYGLPFVQLVDGKGEMKPETAWPGVFVKKADAPILEDLKARGLLFAAPKFEHSYPHCWRCDTPLIYYARESWFIRMTAVKDDLIANNNDHPLDPGKHRYRPVRRLAGERAGLGHQPEPVLGHAAERLEMRLRPYARGRKHRGAAGAER